MLVVGSLVVGLLVGSLVGFFWFLNDCITEDKSAIETYIEGKKQYGQPLVPVSLGGDTIYIIIDQNFAKQIFDLSPKYFGPGKIKINVFNSFMKKNVGITSNYKDWHNRRKLNNEVLDIDIKHRYASEFNQRIKKEFQNIKTPKNSEQFFALAKKIVCSIVFNDSKKIPEQVFKMFKKANNFRAIISKKFHLKEELLKECNRFFMENIQNPKPKSLVEIGVKAKSLDYCCPHLKNAKSTCEQELLNQLPHWMFPTMKLLYTTLPRLLLLLANHPDALQKVINEIKSININDSNQIYQLKYLRKCVLETLRLNNVTVVTLRRLKKEYSFDYNDKYKFKPGTQFIILSNPLLREAEKYENPNKFIPERWNKQLEDSYYAVMFNQGPQRCPGKELALFISQSFIAHYLTKSNFNLKSDKINTEYIEQMINPFKIKFY